MKETVVTYLQEKILGVNLKNPKANVACKLLYPHTEELQELCDIARRVLLVKTYRIDQGMYRGKAKLLATAYNIGKEISIYIGLEDLYAENLIRIGCLFIEGMMVTNRSIHAGKDEDFKGSPLKAPLVLMLTKNFEEELGEMEFYGDDTTEMPIPRISSLIQGNNRPLIKRWGEGKTNAFLRLLKDDPAFVKGADVLQQTAWQINEGVFEVLNGQLKEYLIDPDHTRCVSKALANRFIFRKAEHWLGKTFYQYVDFDFRGRVYYREAFMNYQGSDLSRGLMQFAEGKPLGESGSFWLAVHTACSFNEKYEINDIPDWCTADYRTFLNKQGLTDISVDKMTLEDRAMWTKMNMKRILSDDPFGGVSGFEKVEKPVLALACCLEWRKIEEQGDDYLCHLPIPIDGSNNGWQHLGALSKDTDTGRLVSLVPCEIPDDFYVTTAQKLLEYIPEWFEERDIPMKHIRKGISKRGSMTKAYSAGIEATAENMWADIKKDDFDSLYNITESDCKMLSIHLDKAIREVCPGPLSVMKYLQDLAQHELNTTNGTKIKWTTPSGFPVIQEYLLEKDIKFRANIKPPKGELWPKEWKFGRNIKVGDEIVGCNGEVFLSGIVYLEGVAKRQKAASAISPNFIHSMDAAHMAIVLENWDGAFGAVHDSFSCHACDVEALMTITRQAFVHMYGMDNPLDMARDMILTNPEDFEDNQPELGTLDIQEVMNSDFFFA